MLSQSIRLLILLGFILGAILAATAQPGNDECTNATDIVISGAGYDLDTFSTTYVSLSQATTNLNEPFPLQLTNQSNDKKSVWFKFTLPTKRKLTFLLEQQGNVIASSDVGMAIYASTNCYPALSTLSTQFTPLTSLGKKTADCFEPGTYFIQVGSKQNVSGSIRIRIVTEKTAAAADWFNTPYNFGILTQGLKQYALSTSCLSMENTNANLCGSTTINTHKKTAWFTFTTDNFHDYIRIELAKQTGNLATDATGDIYYTLYEGNAQTLGINGLTTIDACTKMNTSGSKRLLESYCNGLKTNTTYTVKLLIHTDLKDNILFNIYQYGLKSAVGLQPITSSLGTNSLGVLAHTITGVSTRDTAYFGCNNQMISTACGTENPSNGITIGSASYDLAEWFYFEIANTSTFRITPSNAQYLLRLYKTTLTNNCNDVQSTDLIKQFNSTETFYCFAQGKYALQVLGQSNLAAITTSGSQFGTSLPFTFFVQDLLTVNHFSLSNSSKVNKLNNNIGLPYTTTIAALADTFGCDNTVIPENIACSGQKSKAIYRTFRINDNDADGVKDSGYIKLTNLNIAEGIRYQLFKNDLSSLATSQSKYNAGDTIKNTNDFVGCITTSQKGICVKNGDYTLVSLADNTMVGKFDKPSVQLISQLPQYSNRASAENLGDLSSLADNASKSSNDAVFTCTNNPETIDGFTPCNNANKLIYREFYLSKPSILSIEIKAGAEYASNTSLRVFKGKATSGANLTIYNDTKNGNWNCFTKLTSDLCEYFPVGWYTVVSYASGISYDDNQASGTATSLLNSVTITRIKELAKPSFYRPYLAHKTNGGTPIQKMVSSEIYPDYTRKITLPSENFNCQTDTPFSTHPISSCLTNQFRVAYYTFTTKDTLSLSVRGINPSFYTAIILPIDVTKDSTLVPTSTPIQPCQSGETSIEICGLLPNTYTLVIFANNGAIGRTISPQLWFSNMETTRFDFAKTAYDFDTIPGNNQWQFGKKGDTHPRNALWSPSIDIIQCFAGADSTDPRSVNCIPYQNNNVYKQTSNFTQYTTPINGNIFSRKNIWYTFLAEETGEISISVKNVTKNKSAAAYRPLFTVYESDEVSNLAWTNILSNGNIDSTLALGLTQIATNTNASCGANSESLSFITTECNNKKHKRFFILVDQAYNLAEWGISHIEVGIKYRKVVNEAAVYDFFNNANRINGLTETQKPYTNVNLTKGEYSGASASLICATKASTDFNTCGDRTVWYSFSIADEFTTQLSYDVDGIGRFFNENEIKLYKQIIANDSTSSGLVSLNFYPITYGSEKWGETCLDPGTYYIMITGCSYQLEKLKPHLKLLEKNGDYCYDALELNISGVGTDSKSTTINCHTIGSDFAEDGSNMGCLNGPNGYKSSWYAIKLVGADKYDLNVSINEQSSAAPSDLSFRLFYGDCKSLTPSECASSGNQTLSLKCLEAGNYMVQVLSPINTTGTIGITASTTLANSQMCISKSTLQPLANLSYGYGCASDSVVINNLSSRGDSITYLWKFPTLGYTQTSLKPFLKTSRNDTVQIIPVSLFVTNKINNSIDSISTRIYVFPKVANILGRDTLLCEGDSITLSARYLGFGNTYLWEDGSTETTRVVKTGGVYYVDVVTDSCTFSDTIKIGFGTPPVADFLSKDICINTLDSLVNNTDTKGAIIQYKWNLDDGLTSTNSTPQFTYTTKGIKNIELIAKNQYGCADTISKSLEVFANPSADFIVSNECVYKDLVFSNSSTDILPLTYNWSFGDGQVESNVNATHKYSTHGSYNVSLVAKNIKNCIDTIIKTVQVFAKPTADINTSSDAQCFANNSFIYNDISSIISGTISSRKWTLYNNLTNTAPSVVLSYPTQGTYDIKLLVESDQKCLDSVTKTVTIYPMPKVDFTVNDSIQCLLNNSYSFNSKSSIENGSLSNYQWEIENKALNGSIIDAYQFATQGLKTVKHVVTSNFGCKDSVNKIFRLIAQPNPDFSGLKAFYCQNQDESDLKPISTGGTFYGTGISGNRYSPYTIGVDNIKYVVDNEGCFDSLTKQVVVYRNPELTLGPDSTICSSDYVLLDAGTGFDTYLWQNGSTSQTFVTNEAGLYKVTVSNKCGKISAERRLITIGDNCDMYFPNAISPNNDALNEIFRITHDNTIKITELSIFSRWGQMIFSAGENQEKTWNGKQNGEVVPAGTYGYILRYDKILPDNSVLRKTKPGVITVIR